MPTLQKQRRQTVESSFNPNGHSLFCNNFAKIQFFHNTQRRLKNKNNLFFEKKDSCNITY